MKRCLSIGFLILVLSSMGLAQEKQAAAQPKEMLVKIQSENFRAAPSGEIIGKLNAGTKVTVLSQQGNWAKVQVEGYIWMPSLTADPSDVVGFKMHAMHILLRTEEDAKKVLKELLAGADFSELALKYSVDPGVKVNKGDLGEFEKGDLVKEFEDAVLKLKPGQISGIVKTPLGYHIIKRIK